MLPGTALMPATAPELKKAAYDAGVQLLKLLEQGIRAQDIVTKESFENAVMVHAAISGSTNATMHLPAIAHEFGIEIDADTFDRMHRGAHYLLNIRPSGDWPAQYFYYAGGVPRVMEEIRSMLHLDAMTVTGENARRKSGRAEKERFLRALRRAAARKNRTSEPQTAAHRHHPHVRKRQGHRRQHCHSQRATQPPRAASSSTPPAPKRCFRSRCGQSPYDSEEACIAAVLHGDVRPGDAVFIRYEGPRGSGMPEMFYTGEAICADPALASSVALITDGRFSGASRGETEEISMTAVATPDAARLVFAAVAGLILLLVLIIKFKVHAMISILIGAVGIGLMAGMPPVRHHRLGERGHRQYLKGYRPSGRSGLHVRCHSGRIRRRTDLGCDHGAEVR